MAELPMLVTGAPRRAGAGGARGGMSMPAGGTGQDDTLLPSWKYGGHEWVTAQRKMLTLFFCSKNGPILQSLHSLTPKMNKKNVFFRNFATMMNCSCAVSPGRGPFQTPFEGVKTETPPSKPLVRPDNPWGDPKARPPNPHTAHRGGGPSRGRCGRGTAGTPPPRR